MISCTMLGRQAATAVVILLAVSAVEVPADARPSPQHFVRVSLTSLHLAPQERIVGFHFEVTSGRIVQVRDMPIGWNISVDNDPSWNTKLDASIIVASAAVDASFFKDFIVIEQGDAADNPLELKGEIVVSRDFSKTRRIPVGMTDFTLERKPPAPASK